MSNRKRNIAEFHPAVQRIMVATARTHPNSGLCVCEDCLEVRAEVEDELQAFIERDERLKADHERMEFLEGISPSVYFTREEDCGTVGWQIEVPDHEPHPFQVDAPTLRQAIDDWRSSTTEDAPCE